MNETTPPPAQPSRLNVGCGNDIIKGYINLDAVELAGVDVVHNLTEFPWPFGDNRFEEVRMVNVLEHLPDLIRTMEEVWRISKDGCRVIIRVPYWNSWKTVGDPTHTNSFHDKTFEFFDPDKTPCQERPYYTHARFRIRRIDYWLPLFPFDSGSKWLKIRNKLLKGLLYFAAMYLNNIIWMIEVEFDAIKK